MHKLRTATLLAGALAVAAPVGAQARDPFRDGWFWGAKTGVTTVRTSESPRTHRPMFGAEWLITRSVGGLNVFADYTDFDLRGSIPDPSAPNGRRVVNFSNLRRFGFAALAFPKTFGFVRPYGGVGLALNVLGRARAVPDTAGATVDQATADRVEDARSRATPLGMVGAHAQLGRAAAFVQFTMMPPYRDFLINEGTTRLLEVGLRYNVGTSIDRPGRR